MCLLTFLLMPYGPILALDFSFLPIKDIAASFSGDHEEFKRAVMLVINSVNFEKNTTVQVFEATIRYMRCDGIRII